MGELFPVTVGYISIFVIKIKPTHRIKPLVFSLTEKPNNKSQQFLEVFCQPLPSNGLPGIKSKSNAYSSFPVRSSYSKLSNLYVYQIFIFVDQISKYFVIVLSTTNILALYILQVIFHFVYIVYYCVNTLPYVSNFATNFFCFMSLSQNFFTYIFVLIQYNFDWRRLISFD